MGYKHSRIRKQVRTTGINPREAASCYGKIRFTREQAYGDVYSTQKAYKCQFCSWFHKGRKPVASKP